jgi:zinc protease
MPITSAHFNIGFHIPAYSAPEFPALEVLNSALAGDQNAYLCRQLVQVQPWFNYLYSYVMSTKEPGMLVIGGELETAKMDSAFNALFEELSKIASSGLPPEDIESARGRLICSDNNKHESFFQRAESYCYYDLCSDLSLEPLYPQRISSVTNSDILSVFSRFIIPNNLTISLVVPENSGELNIAGWVEHFQPVVIPPPSETAKLPPAEAFILNNGVTLLLQPDISVRTVSMEIFLRGGQWAEAKDKAGIADFTGRVLAKGPTGMTTEDFSRTLGEMGASFTAWTEEDYFRAELNASAEVFSQAVDLAGNALLHPGFRDDDINAVRREKLAEIKGLPDQTYDYVHQEINSLLYKRNPYGKPIIGTEKSVSAITADDLKSFYGESFIGRNLIIALAGNFEKNSTYELLNEMFSNLEAGMQFSYKPQEERLPSKPEIKIIDKERAQTTYDMAWVTASTNSEDYLPLTLAMRMLSSRMFFRFVYQEGICYRMWTRCAETIAPSKFYFETGISPSNFNFSQTEVLKELKSFLKEPITDEMLSDAKKESITKTKLGTETPSALASALGKYYLLGYGPDYLYRYPHLINKITVEEVERVARKYLDPDKFTMVVVGKVK